MLKSKGCKIENCSEILPAFTGMFLLWNKYVGLNPAQCQTGIYDGKLLKMQNIS